MGHKGWYNPSMRGMVQTRQFVKDTFSHMEFPILSGPLLVIVHFRMTAPHSLKNWKRKAQHMTPHAKKPDGDNLEKFLNDSLNGILWKDDANIAILLRTKTITCAPEGETIIFAREIDPKKLDFDLITKDIIENMKFGEENANP